MTPRTELSMLGSFHFSVAGTPMWKRKEEEVEEAEKKEKEEGGGEGRPEFFLWHVRSWGLTETNTPDQT